MSKKYQVFISSTYKDLIEERNAAVEAILKAGHIPAGMELFKAGKSQLETIKEWIDDSDIYLLILGKRYGSIDPETGKSYTQLEYEYALGKENFPIFSIVLKDEYIESKLETGINRDELFESENNELLGEFLELVKTQIVSFAGSLPEVKLAIHENIPEIERNNDLDGWIRASVGNNDKVIKEIHQLAKIAGSSTEGNSEIEFDLEEEIEKSIDIYGKRRVQSGSGYGIHYSNYNENAAISYKVIFCGIAPRLLEHPNDYTVKKIISSLVVDKTDIKDSGSFTIKDESFQKVKIHLTKIGLVSTRYSKTTRGGMSLFWSLTKKGKEKMVEWVET
ncbi:DUF4062 domain-containing protein [Spirochaeta dissipatitropha]